MVRRRRLSHDRDEDRTNQQEASADRAPWGAMGNSFAQEGQRVQGGPGRVGPRDHRAIANRRRDEAAGSKGEGSRADKVWEKWAESLMDEDVELDVAETAPIAATPVQAAAAPAAPALPSIEAVSPAQSAAAPALSSQSSTATSAASHGVTPRHVPASDTLVDDYMAAHWDSGLYYATADRYGFAQGTLRTPADVADRLLPADTSPATRRTVHFAAGLGAGLLDSVALALTPSLVRMGLDAAAWVGEIAERNTMMAGQEDWTGLALGTAIDIAHLQLGTTADAIDKVGTMVDLTQLATHGAQFLLMDGPLAAIFGAVGTAGGPAGTVAGAGAAGGTAAAGHVAQEVVLDTVSEALHVTAFGLRGMITGLDLLQTIHCQLKAVEADERGQAAIAAQYRDLAVSSSFDGISQLIESVAVVLDFVPGLAEINALADTTLGVSIKDGMHAQLGALKLGADFARETHTGQGIQNLIGRGTGGLAEALTGGAINPRTLNLADPMQMDPEVGGHFVQRRELDTANPSALSAARGRTIAMLEADYASLEGDAPEWYQGLVSRILEPEGLDLSQASSPTHLVLAAIDMLPGLGELLGDLSFKGLAGACDLAAGALEGDLSLLSDALTLAMAELKPTLEASLVELNATVQEQQIHLGAVREGCTLAREGLAQVGSLTQIKDAGYEQVQLAINLLAGMRLDSSSMPGVPPAVAAMMVAPINAQIDGLLVALKAEGLAQVDALQDHLDAMREALEAKLTVLEQVVEKGGALETALQEAVATLQDLLQRATDAFTGWDGVVVFDLAGARVVLRTVAEAARKAAAEESQADKADPWPTIIDRVALPAIAEWKARHSEEVESQHQPAVPEWEIEAAEKLGTEALDAGLSPEQHRAVLDAMNACLAQRGKRGQHELHTLWRAEERLLQALKEEA